VIEICCSFCLEKADSLEAISLALSKDNMDFDLVLLDLNMPCTARLSGYLDINASE